MNKTHTNRNKESFFIGKLSFLNVLLGLFGHQLFQTSILIISISLMAYIDYNLDGHLNGISIYVGAPIGTGIGAWLLKRKEGKGFLNSFLPWSSLTAFFMMFF